MSFTLADPRRHRLGDPVIGGGTPGRVTQEKGILSYFEVRSQGVLRVRTHHHRWRGWTGQPRAVTAPSSELLQCFLWVQTHHH